MIILHLLIPLLLLSSSIHSSPIDQKETSEDYEYESEAEEEEFVEKISYTLLIHIDATPSSFFSLLPAYLNEVSTVLDLPATVARPDGFDQIFVTIDGKRVLITQQNSTSCSALSVEVVLEIDTSICGPSHPCFQSRDHLYQLINGARETFSSISISQSPMISPPSSPSSTLLIILLPIFAALSIIVLLAVVQIRRRSPKKRTRTIYAPTFIPSYDFVKGSPKSLSCSPSHKRSRPLNPAPSKSTSTLLHTLASGAGPVTISETERWMVNTRDENGRTPLHCLATAPYDKKTPSQMESDALNLISWGVDVNGRDKEGNTALHLSLTHSRLTLINILLRNPSIQVTTINEREQTPLHIAASLNDYIALDSLLQAPDSKRTLDLTDFHNRTALVLNTQFDPSEVNFTRKLLVNGADPNYPGDKILDDSTDIHLSRTPLHYAAQLGMREHVKVLIEFGAKVNAHDALRRTPLHYAVSNLKLSTIHLLVSLGADTGVQDIYFKTPLQHATEIGFREAIDFLTSHHLMELDSKVTKRKRRGATAMKKKSSRRSSTDTGYQSGCHLEELQEEEEEGEEGDKRGEEIHETPSRSVPPRPTSQLFPFPAPPSISIPPTPTDFFYPQTPTNQYLSNQYPPQTNQYEFPQFV